MTGLEIGLLVVLGLSLFGGGAATGVAISKGNDSTEEVVAEAMAPYVKELENVEALIDPERTPFCNEKSDKYDGFTCVTLELCAVAVGSGVEVSSDCKSFANVIVTAEITRLAASYADSYWYRYSKNGPVIDESGGVAIDSEAWVRAKDDFMRQWEKRKGG